MNQISPSLGRELDLSLNFDRITIREDLSTLSVVNSELTAQQLEQLRTSTNTRRGELNGKIDTANGTLGTKKAELGALTNPTNPMDEEERSIRILGVQQEITELEQTPVCLEC